MDMTGFLQAIPADTLAQIGRLAITEYLLRQAHEQNKVLESQSRLGPGATAESARDAGAARGQMEVLVAEAILRAREPELPEDPTRGLSGAPPPASPSAPAATEAGATEQTSADGGGPSDR